MWFASQGLVGVSVGCVCLACVARGCRWDSCQGYCSLWAHSQWSADPWWLLRQGHSTRLENFVCMRDGILSPSSVEVCCVSLYAQSLLPGI